MSLQNVAALADHARQVLENGANRPFAPAVELREGAELVSTLAFDGTPEPVSQPVVDRHLDQPSVRAPEAAEMLARLRAASPSLTWGDIHDGYGGEPGMEHFCRNYSYTPLAVPARWARGVAVPSPDVGLSFTIQAPGTYYPDHAHKAVEIYYVIAGKALWKRGGEPWIERYPGDIILHTAGMRHAMQTGDEPLIAMAVWITDVESGIVGVRA
ncbi:MAG: dimethylsulfonioproprionate lyase family protein [Alphaproteobacteria bacterium]|nr:dimethylsulfonioproprionate lyase family protein [Alphaproteobacteria bacterium]